MTTLPRLSPSQQRVWHAICANPGLNQTRISELARVSHRDITNICVRLEHLGYIRRERRTTAIISWPLIFDNEYTPSQAAYLLLHSDDPDA